MPVFFERYGQPGLISITSTSEAAQFLLNLRVQLRGRTHNAAMVACRDVLRGQASDALARCEFVEAVLEAGYYVLPDTFLSPMADTPSLAETKTRPFDGAGKPVREPSLTELVQSLRSISVLLVTTLAATVVHCLKLPTAEWHGKTGRTSVSA